MTRPASNGLPMMPLYRLPVADQLVAANRHLQNTVEIRTERGRVITGYLIAVAQVEVEGEAGPGLAVVAPSPRAKVSVAIPLSNVVTIMRTQR